MLLKSTEAAVKQWTKYGRVICPSDARKQDFHSSVKQNIYVIVNCLDGRGRQELGP